MILPASIDTIQGVYNLICNLENEQFDYNQFITLYKKNLLDRDICYYVYLENQQVLGFISLHVKNLLHHNGKTGEIAELIIDENHRSQQIGRKLIYYVKEEAKKKQLLEIEVSSNVRRTRSHSFYEKNGFIKNHYNLVLKL